MILLFDTVLKRIHTFILSLFLYNTSFQMINYKVNPYAVHPSSDEINSQVVSLILKDETGKIIDVTNLHTDISLTIPLKKSKNSTRPLVPEYSVPEVMTYRVVTTHHEKTSIRISLRLDRGKPFQVYIKYGTRPTQQDYDFFTTLDKRPCQKRNKLCNVTHHVWYDAKHCGKYFIGLLQKDSTSKLRKRRSDSDTVSHENYASRNNSPRRRISRSLLQVNDTDEDLCVKTKVPPMREQLVRNITLISPPYDPETSVNFSLEVNSAGCLYWSEKKEAWMSEGCKVRKTHDS